MEITQCRMARAALDWSLDDLQRASRSTGHGVSRRTIAKFEAGETVSGDSVAALRMTFESMGVVFIDHGVHIGGVVPPIDGRDWRSTMAVTKRVLKSRGSVKLIETSHPGLGTGYSVWNRSLGLWSGENLIEAERQFEQAVEAGPR